MVMHYSRCLILIMLLLQASQSILSFSSLCSLRRVPPSSSLRTSTTSYHQYTSTLFDLNLPDGRCVGFILDEEGEDESLENWSDPTHWVHSCLHPAEVSYGKEQTRAVRKSFLLGRMAMRASLALDGDHVPCLKDSFGRPTLPPSHFGSISHKGNVGVALTAPSSPFTAIGVDIEQLAPKRRSIASKVLTAREIEELGGLEMFSAEEEVMLRFSLKEAIYKSISPLIDQYVGFQEAEVSPQNDGTAKVRWYLNSGAHKKLDSVQAHWCKVDNYFLTSSTSTLLVEGGEEAS